jgi:hypothetical protein
MASLLKNREKRIMADIGKDSDDLIMKLKSISANKKLNKKQIIYRALQYCYSVRLNLSESLEKPITKKDLEKLKNEIINEMRFYIKDVDSKIKVLEKK